MESTGNVQPDTRGVDAFRDDSALTGLLGLYLPAADLDVLTPALSRLGVLVGGRLDELAHTADRNPPVLHHRDRRGDDRQWIEKHPAYAEMERIEIGRAHA